jgi:hypothetical protein
LNFVLILSIFGNIAIPDRSDFTHEFVK